MSAAPTAEQVEAARALLASLGDFGAHIQGDDVAHLEVNGNEVVGSHLVPGLDVDVEQIDDGIEAHIHLQRGVHIANPVHLCFGMLPTEGLQHIIMKVDVEEDSFASVQAHCTFPNAIHITHKMDAEISIAPGGTYEYFERHLHGAGGGVIVVPKTRVNIGEGGRFKTEFELIKGQAGVIDFDYEVNCGAFSTLDMIARIFGRGDDRITINEVGHLNGEGARAVLRTAIALKDEAVAEVFNTLTASAAGARGHVDCKEIVQGNARAKAVPVVEVNHPLAHVTHEAAIGSVDSKQLQTLMSRGLGEEAATDLIIGGLLG
jgi:Fe-S cluster assembly scaffold protein SufB